MVVLCLETGANFLSRKHMNERSIHSPPSSSSFCGMDPKLESQSLLKLSSTSARAAQDSTGRSFPKQEGTQPNSTYINFFFFLNFHHSCIAVFLDPLVHCKVTSLSLNCVTIQSVLMAQDIIFCSR